MSDGDGNHPEDEDVEYLEQLICEQIRTVHDAGFQRLEQSLRDAINGLERARKGLDDLVQRDLDKALKKLVRTVPDEVAQAVTQVVTESLPGDYSELVADAQELGAKVRVAVSVLEEGSKGFQDIAHSRMELESHAKKLGQSFEKLCTRVEEVRGMLQRIDEQTQKDPEWLAKLTYSVAAISERLDARYKAHAEATEELKRLAAKASEGSASGLELLAVLKEKMASTDLVDSVGRKVEEATSSVSTDLANIRKDITTITQLGRKIDSDGSQRAERLETVSAEARSYYSNLSTLTEKIAGNLQKKQEEAVAKYIGGLATTENLQHLLELTEQARAELSQVLVRLDGKIVGIANLATALGETADLITHDLQKLGLDLERSSHKGAEEHETIRQLISRAHKEVDGSVSNMAQSLSEELRQARTTLSNDAHTAFSGLNERIEGAIAQISALNLALANTDAALRVHIGDWKREITYAKKVAEETRTLVSVFFAFVALIVSAVPVCAAVWWWFQK